MGHLTSWRSKCYFLKANVDKEAEVAQHFAGSDTGHAWSQIYISTCGLQSILASINAITTTTTITTSSHNNCKSSNSILVYGILQFSVILSPII